MSIETIPMLIWGDFIEAFTERAEAVRTGNGAEPEAQMGPMITAPRRDAIAALVQEAETPFGGVKQSGYGTESGIEGLDAYLRTKMVTEKYL